MDFSWSLSILSPSPRPPSLSIPISLRPNPPLQVVGDDLTVTNPVKIKRAVEEKAANALLLKARPLTNPSVLE